MFTICANCAEQLAQDPCQHNDEDRSLQGTWVSVEIKKALELNYRVVEAFEVWHFSETTTELFDGYINTFLKLKQENSKLPDWCKSEEDVAAYKSQYANGLV